MSHLEIRLRLTRTELDRFREQRREPANPLARTRAGNWLRRMPFGSAIMSLSIPGLVAVSILLIAGVFYVSTPVAVINDMPVRARRILLLADESLDSTAKAQNDRLAAAGMVVDRGPALYVRRPSGGFVGAIAGITALIAGSDLPSRVEGELLLHPDVDAVYLISSFTEADDPALLTRLQTVIRDNGARVYLETAKAQPSPELQAIARESGGGLISPVRN